MGFQKCWTCNGFDEAVRTSLSLLFTCIRVFKLTPISGYAQMGS